MDINKTLAERGSRYGTFVDQAMISQNLIRAMSQSRNWDSLDEDMREALQIIANKISRILNGDPNYHDSWHDIVGYAKLVADRLVDTPPIDQQIQMVWGIPAEMIDDE